MRTCYTLLKSTQRRSVAVNTSLENGASVLRRAGRAKGARSKKRFGASMPVGSKRTIGMHVHVNVSNHNNDMNNHIASTQSRTELIRDGNRQMRAMSGQ